MYHHIDNYPPIRSKDLFGNDKPLEMDIGCGTGEFICRLAEKYPETNYIGVEVSFKPIYRAVETAAAASLENIRFIRADINLMRPLMPAESLRKAYFHFPIPIRKASRKKHVIFTPSFLDDIHKALEPEGCISVMSDDKTFFETLRKTACQDSRFCYIPRESGLPKLPEKPSRAGNSGPSVDDLSSELHDGHITYCQFIWERRGCPTFGFLLKKKPDREGIDRSC